MDKPLPSPHSTAIPSVSRRSVVIVIAVLIAVHSVLVMVWVMPVNPIRDAVGQQRLSGYINPYFEQSWSVFAPVPRRGGENVLIRARMGGVDGGPAGTVTKWFDVTADEDRRIRFLANPARFHNATRRLGGNINSAMANYGQAQLTLVANDFVQRPRSELGKALARANTTGLVGQANNEAYLLNDEMLSRFATMYATARWGRGVTMVQFRVGHRSVPNFSLRNDINFLDVAFTYYSFGWRKALPGNADAQAAFDGYVNRAPERADSSTQDSSTQAGQ